ncbi:MAG: Tm-1-like ATP-binding domain-containing protein, partial [Proteobacteria bacterium]|nr:Tm-1-like ATP-binding domain-containing protein [Pseudomonadota bacterium]
MTKTLALVGTLDTKGDEIAFLRDLVAAAGLQVMVIDIGVLGRPALKADVSNRRVARRGGVGLDELKSRGEEDFAQPV